MVAAGSVEVVLAAMRQHTTAEKVQEFGCAALGRLAAPSAVMAAAVAISPEASKYTEVDTSLFSLGWEDARKVLAQHEAGIRRYPERPRRFQPPDSRVETFIESPKLKRRPPGSDLWHSSGGVKGSVEHWFDDRIGLRKRVSLLA